MSSLLTSLSILVTNPVPVDSVRSSLEGREEFWFICLLVASGGVAIGCVLEIPETWAELTEWRRLRKEGTAKPSWRFPMGAIGLFLVVMGVIGEGVFEALVSMNETALRAHDEQVLAETIIQAGDAKNSAKDAATAAKGAVTAAGTALALAKGAREEADSYAHEIASAKQQSADAVSRLADTVSRLAAAEQRAAKAESDFAKAQSELDKLTGAPFPVPVIHWVATPDLSQSTKQLVVLTGDTLVRLPVLPKGKSLVWTLILKQDSVGQHQFKTLPKVTPENVLFNPPDSAWVLTLLTDDKGTINIGAAGAAYVPAPSDNPK